MSPLKSLFLRAIHPLGLRASTAIKNYATAHHAATATTELKEKSARILTVNGIDYHYYSLPAAEAAGLKGLAKLPFTLKILLENLLRHEDGRTVTDDDVRAVLDWLKHRHSDREIAYRPARVLMQDFTGVTRGGRSRGYACCYECARWSCRKN